MYRKALSTPDLDDLSVITSAWIRFERCNGTLDQLKICQEQCDERLIEQQIQNTYSGRNSYVGRNANSGAKSQKRKTFDRPVKKFAAKTENIDGKKKPQDRSNVIKNTVNMGPPAAKREKLDNSAEIHDSYQVNTTNDDTTIFLSNLAYR